MFKYQKWLGKIQHLHQVHMNKLVMTLKTKWKTQSPKTASLKGLRSRPHMWGCCTCVCKRYQEG